jgi:ABC-type oligopeptide transport system substrate-binding subunit
MYTNSKVIDIFGTMVAMVSSVDGSEQLEFVPHHLSELPYSEDGGITWICKFRDDVVWYEDDTPINADTYEYTFKMLLDPKLVNKNAAYVFDPCRVINARAYYAGECEWEDVGIKNVGDNTLEITLEYPSTPVDFYSTLGTVIWPVHPEIYEAGMNEDRTSTTYGTTVAETPSSGPFYLKEWVLDGYEVFALNEKDPLVKMGYFFADEINGRYVSETATIWQMFQNAELDWAPLSGDLYEANKNDPRANTSKSPMVWGILVNGASDNVIMQDNDFRLALYYSTPRVQVATEVYVLYKSPNYIISEGISVQTADGGTMYYRDTPEAKAIVERFADNDELALELFDKAYEANGSQKITVEMTYFDEQEDMKRTAEVCQEKWENLFGSDRFELVLRAVQPAQAYDNYRIGDYDLGTGTNLTNVFNMWSSFNIYTSDYADKYVNGFANEEFDQLYFDSVYGELMDDPQGRIEALARMEELLMEYVPFIPAMQNDNTWLTQEWVELPTYTYLPFVGFGFRQSDILPH